MAARCLQEDVVRCGEGARRPILSRCIRGEMMEEDRQEFDPLDEPEEDADDTPLPYREESLKGGCGRNGVPRLSRVEGIPIGEALRRKA